MSRLTALHQRQLLAVVIAATTLAGVVGAVVVRGGRNSPTDAVAQATTTAPKAPKAAKPSRPRPQRAASATPVGYQKVTWTFDTGASGWVPLASTAVAWAHSPVQSGTGALALRNKTTGTVPIAVASGSNKLTLTPARRGWRVFGTVAVRSNSKPRKVFVTLAFLNSRQQQIAQAAGQTLVDSTSTWQSTYRAVGIAPPNTAYVVMRVSVAAASPGETHVLDNASLAEYPGSSDAVAGPLHTSGTRILDANGHTVTLRGFTRVGLEGADADAPTQDDIAHAKAWGANVIRLPLGEQFWLSSSCHRKTNYVAQVDDAVHLVTSLGMVAMLDLHWNSLTSCGSYGQQPMADYPGSVTFWQQVATRYKHNPLVAFELYNEPHDISDAVWRNGGTVTWKGQTFTAAGMQQMYAAVRSTGASNLVFVSGTHWANYWPSTAPVTGTNIVYGVHAYTCPLKPPPNCDNGAPYDPSQYFRYWTAASKTVPVAVTEFGWPDPMDGRYMTAVINYAEARGWGWTAFTWGDKAWGPFSLLAGAGPGKFYEPKPTGEVVLAALPGA